MGKDSAGKKIVLGLIKFYKQYISRGYYCRMVPSCSEYTYQAVDKYGVGKGIIMGIRRVGKCHPWGKSGVDLVE
ncbi:MAG: membrane protein insertion efficiency factor YidD [Candidatus Shapirobacteria bacterium]|jgi:hypothetical protein